MEKIKTSKKSPVFDANRNIDCDHFPDELYAYRISQGRFR